VQLLDLAAYVQDRVPEISRELKACDAKKPGEYCQKPIVPIHSDNYPIVPRYPAILAELSPNIPVISRKPTHVLLADADVFDTVTRGAPIKRKLEQGEQVSVVKIDGGLAQVAQGGVALGYVDASKLLKLKN
jgi:hypothetical protein